MHHHLQLKPATLHALMKTGTITFAGNKRLKIYGTLWCASGKRMKMNNRVFFTSSLEAENMGYRPCKHCLDKVRKKRVDDVTASIDL